MVLWRSFLALLDGVDDVGFWAGDGASNALFTSKMR